MIRDEEKSYRIRRSSRKNGFRRSGRINIPVYETEKAQARALAEKYGLTVATYLRRLISKNYQTIIEGKNHGEK